jgi:hypothetical protein
MLMKWFERREYFEERLRWGRLDDQALALLSHNCVLARKFEFTRNPHSLIPAVLEEPC